MSNYQSPADAEHLRRVIEKQPSCVVRAGIDGILLAVNDAALGLLGAREIDQVLGTTLTARIVPEHQERWNEFSATIAADSARSLECDLTDLAGVRKQLLFHGVPLLDHPDGVPSMILGARDVSALRRLETSHEAHAQSCPQESESTSERVQRVLAERDQLQTLLKAGRKHLEDQRAQLATMAAERRRLETQLAEREAGHQQAIDEQMQAQRTLIDQHRLNQESATQAAQQQVDALRAQLTQAAAEHRRLETQIEQQQGNQESATQTAQQQVDALQAQLTQAAAEHRRLETQIEQQQRNQESATQAAQQQADALQAQLSQAAAEHRRLETQIEQQQRNQESVSQAAQQQVDALRAQLTQAVAEQRRLETQLAQRDVDLIEELAAERARVDEALAAAALKQRQMTQELADRAVELHYTELTAKQLAPLAVAGRLALEVAADLQRIVAAIDDQAAGLLADCPPEASHRSAVEALRGDAIRARSLTSQIAGARLEAETDHPLSQS